MIWVLVCCQKVRQERCFLAVGILGLVVLNVNFNLGVDGSIYWILTNRVLLRELDICVSCSEILLETRIHAWSEKMERFMCRFLLL